jgi:hypothetical protein
MRKNGKGDGGIRIGDFRDETRERFNNLKSLERLCKADARLVRRPIICWN